MSFVTSSLRPALEASNGSQAVAQSVAATPAADSALLFKNHLDALLPAQPPITQNTAPAGPEATIKLRELTLPFGSFASAANSVLQNSSGAPSDAPSGLPSGTQLKLGDLSNLPGQSADRFTAHDLDLIFPNYRDPDLNPRADCGETGCGTTSGGTDCGASGCGTTSGGTDCGASGCGTTSGGTDCGASGCGTTSGGTDCGASGCGTTSGGTDCGASGCGTTSGGTDCGASGCGTTSGSRDFFDQSSRIDMLRNQLATQLQLASAGSMIR